MDGPTDNFHYYLLIFGYIGLSFMWGFSSCSEQGLLFLRCLGFSLMRKQKLQSRSCRQVGFSNYNTEKFLRMSASTFNLALALNDCSLFKGNKHKSKMFYCLPL